VRQVMLDRVSRATKMLTGKRRLQKFNGVSALIAIAKAAGDKTKRRGMR